MKKKTLDAKLSLTKITIVELEAGKGNQVLGGQSELSVCKCLATQRQCPTINVPTCSITRCPTTP